MHYTGGIKGKENCHALRCVTLVYCWALCVGENARAVAFSLFLFLRTTGHVGASGLNFFPPEKIRSVFII